MAYLSNYLSNPNRASSRGSRSFGTYPVIRRVNPYRTRYGSFTDTQPTDTGSGFGTQDMAQALLNQRQQNQAAIPSNQFNENYDYDPILARINALASQTLANATTEAAQLRKKAVIDIGDIDIARELGIDPLTLEAARQNPESEVAILEREWIKRQADLENAMQSQNLFYSGEYAKNLSELTQGHASAQGQIGQRLRELLSGIDTGLLGAQEAERQRQLEAAMNAWVLHNPINPKTGLPYTAEEKAAMSGSADLKPGDSAEEGKVYGWYYPPGATQAVFGLVPAGYIYDGGSFHPPGWTPPAPEGSGRDPNDHGRVVSTHQNPDGSYYIYYEDGYVELRFGGSGDAGNSGSGSGTVWGSE